MRPKSQRRKIRKKYNCVMRILILICILIWWSCKPDSAEKSSAPTPPVQALDGRLLLPDSAFFNRRNDSLLQAAWTAYRQNPQDTQNIIWLGRRLGYVWRYQEAIDTLSAGLRLYPESAELLRHRGHRYLTVRQFQSAATDLAKAAGIAKNLPVSLEPDGQPNALNIPLSTLQFNIWYHWGLAHYLQGRWSEAAKIYEECMNYSTNPDLLVATADWLYMTYRRMGDTMRAQQLLARIPDTLQLIENDGYYNRIKMYKGLKQPQELLNFNPTSTEDELNTVTQGYGVANYFLYNGDTLRAREILTQVCSTRYWAAFGYLAAEADLQKLK